MCASLYVRVHRDADSFTYLEGQIGVGATGNSVTVIITPRTLTLIDVCRQRHWLSGTWGALEEHYPGIAADTELHNLAKANCVP